MVKLCDFGIARCLSDSSNSVLRLFGTSQYSDPQYLKDPNKYTRDKRSDVYSVGMLLWELSSGKTPFEQLTGFDLLLSIIVEGDREKVIEGTPLKYAEVYTGK